MATDAHSKALSSMAQIYHYHLFFFYSQNMKKGNIAGTIHAENLCIIIEHKISWKKNYLAGTMRVEKFCRIIIYLVLEHELSLENVSQTLCSLKTSVG